MILFIPKVTVWTVFTICVLYSYSNYCFFNASRCIHNTLFLINVTDNSLCFPDFIFLTSPHERSADPIPRIFEVTLQDTKPRTLVNGEQYFWYHIWLLSSRISLLLQIHSLLSKGSFLWLGYVCSLQNISRVLYNYLSGDPENKVLITVFTFFICFLFYFWRHLL